MKADKPNRTITSQFLAGRRPLSTKEVPSPFPHPPPGRMPIGRLSFLGPTPKLPCQPSQLVEAIGNLQPDAVVFADTNIFTKELDTSIWDAILRHQVFITPGVWKEIQPWLKTPFHNKSLRDHVISAIRGQVAAKRDTKELLNKLTPRVHGVPKIDVLFRDDEFTNSAFEYYFKLLIIRRAIGPIANSVLTKRFGKGPTSDQFLAEVQKRFGERGFRLAKKGLEGVASPNVVTDDELVVMAVHTAILRGSEVLLLTRDGDILEQYFKLISHVKEHYRAMLAADLYVSNTGAMAFQELPVRDDGIHVPLFEGSSFLKFETTDLDFNPLPPTFHFVNVYCFLLGGVPRDMRLTSCSFCGETEIAEVLRVKAATDGLNTRKLNGRDCIIHTAPGAPGNHQVVVSIGRDRTVQFGHFGKFSVNDMNNTFFDNELVSSLQTTL
jgi:hypothetical protein